MHSPKLQFYWNFTIRLFSVVSKTLIGGVSYPLQRCSWCILQPQLTKPSLCWSVPANNIITYIIISCISIFAWVRCHMCASKTPERLLATIVATHTYFVLVSYALCSYFLKFFLSIMNNLHTVIWFQEFLSYTNYFQAYQLDL